MSRGPKGWPLRYEEMLLLGTDDILDVVLISICRRRRVRYHDHHIRTRSSGTFHDGPNNTSSALDRLAGNWKVRVLQEKPE